MIMLRQDDLRLPSWVPGGSSSASLTTVRRAVVLCLLDVLQKPYLICYG